MKNTKRFDGTIEYRILEIGIFGSYESAYDSSRDIDSLFPCYFLENTELSMAVSPNYQNKRTLKISTPLRR